MFDYDTITNFNTKIQMINKKFKCFLGSKLPKMPNLKYIKNQNSVVYHTSCAENILSTSDDMSMVIAVSIYG